MPIVPCVAEGDVAQTSAAHLLVAKVSDQSWTPLGYRLWMPIWTGRRVAFVRTLGSVALVWERQ